MASYLNAPSPRTGAFVPALSWTPSRVGATNGTAAAAAMNSRLVVVMCLPLWCVFPQAQAASPELLTKQGFRRLPDPVLGHEHRPFLDEVRRVGRNAERVVDGRMKILDRHRIFDGRARPLVGR